MGKPNTTSSDYPPVILDAFDAWVHGGSIAGRS